MQVNVCSQSPEMTREYDWDKPQMPQQQQQSGKAPWGWIALGALALVLLLGSGGEK